MEFPDKIDDSLLGRAADALRAYEAEVYISALSLTLPDICGGRLMPEEKKCSVRYAHWFNEYVTCNYTNHSAENKEFGDYYSDGDDCYQLRCIFLHEGVSVPHIEREKTFYNIAQFRIFQNPGIGCDHKASQWTEDESIAFRQVDLDLHKFINTVCEGVRSFVEEHPELNSRNTIEGPEAIFDNPILDFRNV